MPDDFGRLDHEAELPILRGGGAEPCFDVAAAVFAANEAMHLEGCARALAAAAQGRSACLDVVLNGTRDGSLDLLRALHLPGLALRVWEIRLGDKANAINAYLHALRPAASLYVLTDAYARVEHGAIVALEAGLKAHPDAWIACGIPRNGRSAGSYGAHVLRGGAINGNLYALRPAFVERLRSLGYRLPVGLYRTDPLLGSMALHDFDPRTPWNPGRIVGIGDAGYSITPLSPLRPRDLRRQFRREINQARGVLENQAIKQVIYREGYGALTGHADAMVRDYAAMRRDWAGTWRQRVFLPLALRRLRAPPRQPALGDASPRLVHTTLDLAAV